MLKQVMRMLKQITQPALQLDGSDAALPHTNATTCTTQDALKRAMAENPELAKEFEDTLQKRIAKVGVLTCDVKPRGGC